MLTKQQEIDWQRIYELSDKACDAIDEVLNELDIRFTQCSSYIFGPCPIHDGDNPQAWVLYPEGHTVRGLWHCYTRGCHNRHGRYLIHLIQAVLAKKEKDVSFFDAIQWLCTILGFEDLQAIPLPDAFTLDKRIQRTRDYYRDISVKPKGLLNRHQAREYINIPAEYYINRGFSAEVLDKYDVGYDKKDERVVVPIYDPEGEWVIGSTRRSVFEQCEKCKLWHKPEEGCPITIPHKIKAAKWYNRNFEKAQSLYNLWYAKKAIQNNSRQRAILVEGPSDIWKLVEANILNGLALYGLEFSDIQRFLLMQTEAHEIAVLLDEDKAGEIGSSILREKIERDFRFVFGKIPANDFGDLDTKQIKGIQLFKPNGKTYMKLEEFTL